MRLARLLAAVTLLVSCGAQEHDPKLELEMRSRNLRGVIEPLPSMRIEPGLRYQARGMADPFYPERP
jgi:Tfp pilus assembly protein PilP